MVDGSESRDWDVVPVISPASLFRVSFPRAASPSTRNGSEDRQCPSAETPEFRGCLDRGVWGPLGGIVLRIQGCAEEEGRERCEQQELGRTGGRETLEGIKLLSLRRTGEQGFLYPLELRWKPGPHHARQGLCRCKAPPAPGPAFYEV